MNTSEQIAAVLNASALAPAHLEVFDDSSQHAGGFESHFRVVLVSASFDGLARLKRHQQVYRILADILERIHALSLQLHTPQEWNAHNHSVDDAPPCARAK